MSRQASGLRAWFYQRATAIYLILFTIYVVYYFLSGAPAGYEEWRSWVADPLISLGILVFFASMLLHAWVGFRDVLIDYVHPTAIRVGLLTIFGFGLLACGVWALQIMFLAHTA